MTDIEKLKEIIRQIDWLLDVNISPFDREFKEWQSRAKQFLYNKYGADSIEFTGFNEFKFIPDVSKVPKDKSLTKLLVYDACHSDLITIKGLFEDYLRDLQDEETKLSSKSVNEQCLERIFTRFRKVAVQLTRRHSNRETLIIKDEYDVQDLLHSLLKLYFDDVRDEEPIPSYAGASSRTDFYIPEIKTFIEVKKTRSNLKDRDLRDQLIIDIEQYQKHPGCEKIYCFVYDPDSFISNPTGIKNDLEEKHTGLVRVFIES